MRWKLESKVLKQLPVLYPVTIRQSPFAKNSLANTLELIYTALDLEPSALDCGYDGPPFRWDDELRCELDVHFFHLYLPCDKNGDWQPARKSKGAVRDESEEELATLKENFPTPRHAVAYIMDTFHIVKRKDEKAHGHYRTKDRILELYDAILQARQDGQQWQSPLNPPPGPPTDSEGNFLPFETWKSNIPTHIHPPRDD